MLTSLQQAPAGTHPSTAAAADDYFHSVSEIRYFEPAMTDRDAAGVRGLGCFRGLRYALAIEAAACLLLYGLWHLWRIIH
jgi:hypothetical protein